MKSTCGILVLGLTSSFFFMSSGLPANVTKPEVLYLTMFGFVEIAKVNASVTSLVTFFCSSNFALISKNNSSLERYSPVRSACKLLSFIETVTPETEYCGFTVNSSLTSILLIQYLAFVFQINFTKASQLNLLLTRFIECWNRQLRHKTEGVTSLRICFWF